MTHTRHLGRFVAVGVGALVLSGAGIASATTPPTEPPGDTAMAASVRTGGSRCRTEQLSGDHRGGGGNGDVRGGDGHRSGRDRSRRATEAPAGTEAMATEAPAGSEPTASVAAVSGPFVQVAETDEYGPILADHECRTLYIFAPDGDAGGEPTCVDDCAVNWPPLFVPDESVPALADELDPSLFSVVQHPEGPHVEGR